MLRLEWLFLMQIVLGIFMILILQKLIQMKKQMDAIKKEVSDYIIYVTEEESKTAKEEPVFAKNRDFMGENAQNQLIQTVLSEYFP